MLYLNSQELSRKYKFSYSVPKKKLNVFLEPNTHGYLIFLKDGIWIVDPQLLNKVKEDVFFALGLKSPDKEKIKYRVISNPEIIVIEFLFNEEIKV